MTFSALILLILLFFFTSMIGVVTGSNSLITVPVMFQFGIDEKVAVATNMFGLTFMAIGGTIPFVRRGGIDYRKVSPLIILTLISSALGAMLVGLITNSGLKLIVSIAMIAVALFTLLNRNNGSKASGPEHPADSSDGSDGNSRESEGVKSQLLVEREGKFGGVAELRSSSFFAIPTTASGVFTYILVFFLGIYGGLYSGGYVTILTVVLVAFFGMSFTEAVGSTKLINIFSSSIATIIFMWQGLVDYKLGVILAVTMFIGGYAGAHYAAKMNDLWLKRIFLATVFLLAIKTLYDLLS